MGGVALLAKAQGHDVSGSDANVYPPMSTQLEQQGITLHVGYSAEHLEPVPDLVIIGNALSRGNPAIEHVLNHDLRFISGPQWLYENILQGKHVLAVSGTHGKTTTTSILTWILETAGLEPGFLIGGIAENFGCSASPGASEYFVIEADEYDTAFFDKRSKFIHYRPQTLVINNIEFDHADIFSDLAAIRREFHHLIRTVPETGLIIANKGDTQTDNVLAMGCWTPVEYFSDHGAKWTFSALKNDYSEFEVQENGEPCGQCKWQLFGQYNVENAVAAIAAAANAGVATSEACAALASFKSVKRRLEQLAVINGITVYDDFAHHPTAIKAMLSALRQRVGNHRIIAILEPRSNTMRQGIHKDELAPALAEADQSFIFQPEGLAWDLLDATRSLGNKCQVHNAIHSIVEEIKSFAVTNDHIVIISNGSFDSIHQKIISRLQTA